VEKVKREMQQMVKQFESSLIFRNEDIKQQQNSMIQEIRIEKEENEGLKAMVNELSSEI
jgi:hypothetical protein